MNLINPVFLMFQLEALSSQILQTVRGTTADNISSDVLKNVELIVPPIENQNRFVLIAKNIESQKSQIKQQKENSESLLQSLLQKAFKENW